MPLFRKSRFRPPVSVTLYSRAECGLCREALALLERVCGRGACQVRVVDIDGDPELTRRYGMTIPVVEVASGSALEWPFTLADLRRAIAPA